jgi:hypothetical protein
MDPLHAVSRVSSNDSDKENEPPGDDDEGGIVENILSEVFEKIDKMTRLEESVPMSPQAVAKRRLEVRFNRTREMLTEVVEHLDKIQFSMGDVPLRYYERALLILTKSQAFDILANDLAEAAERLHEFAEENNARMEQEILKAMSAPDRAVQRR